MITSKTESKKQLRTGYPKLMMSDGGTVVLMVECGTGFVVHKGLMSSRSLGEFTDEWNIDKFRDYNGSVVLTNTAEET